MTLALSLAAAPRAAVWIEPDPALPDAGDEVVIRLMDGEPFAGRPLVGDGAARFQHVWKSGRAGLSGAEPRIVTSSPGTHVIVYSWEGQGSGGELVGRHAKAILVVGAPEAGSPLRWSETGQRLEIVPQTDPVRLIEGQRTLEVQVLYAREPLAGATLVATPRAEPDSSRRVKTDEIGLARLQLDRQGPWLIRVAHRASCEDCPTPTLERLTSTLVLAVR